MNLRLLLPLFAVCATGLAQTAPRARALGVPFDGTPGPLDAITDVKGVEVGDTTLIHGEGKLVVGQGPVRTGVTVIFPRGRSDADPVYAGWFSQNGNGEMTGTTWWKNPLLFSKNLSAITNTHSVGLVRDSIIAWSVKSGRLAQQPWSLPVVAETWDGYLNDINGFHVQQADVFSALDTAKAGPVPEGNVGGGTGMVCYGFKGGRWNCLPFYLRMPADIPSGCWCNVTVADVLNLPSPECPLVSSFPLRPSKRRWNQK